MSSPVAIAIAIVLVVAPVLVIAVLSLRVGLCATARSQEVAGRRGGVRLQDPDMLASGEGSGDWPAGTA